VLGILIILLPGQVFAKTTVLVLGDSLTAGYGLEKQQAFPQLLNDKLHQMGYTDTHVINGGFSGSTTASALQRLHWYMRIHPDILILELGANDGLRGLSIESIRSNLAKTIEYAKSQNILTILAGMKLPVNYGKAYTHQFEAIFTSLAKEYSLPLIPFLLKDVAGKPELNQSDGIHPNPAGHKIVAETVLTYLLPYLKK